MMLKTNCWIWLAIVVTQAIPTCCAAADDSIARQLPADHELIRRLAGHAVRHVHPLGPRQPEGHGDRLVPRPAGPC